MIASDDDLSVVFLFLWLHLVWHIHSITSTRTRRSPTTDDGVKQHHLIRQQIISQFFVSKLVLGWLRITSCCRLRPSRCIAQRVGVRRIYDKIQQSEGFFTFYIWGQLYARWKAQIPFFLLLPQKDIISNGTLGMLHSQEIKLIKSLTRKSWTIVIYIWFTSWSKCLESLENHYPCSEKRYSPFVGGWQLQ